MGSIPPPPQTPPLDALIVGAGFGGVYQLKSLRSNGYTVKLVDRASDFGGVWYWNRYPGARVDSPVPHYEFSDPDLWRGWSFTQRFPGSQEIRDYFAYVDRKWDLRRDVEFDTRVCGAVFDEEEGLWRVTCTSTSTTTTGGTGSGSEKNVFVARYLLLNAGFAAKRHIPDWKGIETFKGAWIHPSYWPKKQDEQPDLRGKKVAVIGTGATGVQLAQELSQVAGEFVLFQRTPNLALPMKQINYSQDGQQQQQQEVVSKEAYPAIFDGRRESFPGFDYNFTPRRTFDDTPGERRQMYEELWKHGDFHYWLATYEDMMFNKEANKEAYEFWKSKVRPRIQDARLREVLAPEVQPHGFGCKRISLENGFYEIFNQPNVSLVDVNATPILEVTERGIKTSEKEWEFDYIICATGFDAVTGGLLQMGLQGKDGQSLQEKWKNGTKTYLGMAVSGFPNMFFTYGPQAPTALCNGPTCAEYQGDFIIGVMNHMREQGLQRIEASADAEDAWGEDIRKFANATLLPETDSVSFSRISLSCF